MLLFVGSCELFYFTYTFDRLFVFAKRKQDLLDFRLVKMDMGIYCDILNDVALSFKGINGLAFWFWDKRFNLRLVRTTHL
jgi:hypothetical protein